MASLGGKTARVVTWLPRAGGKGLRRLILGAGGEVVFASEGLGAAKVECGRGLKRGARSMRGGLWRSCGLRSGWWCWGRGMMQSQWLE